MSFPHHPYGICPLRKEGGRIRSIKRWFQWEKLLKQVDGDVHKVGVCEECNFLVKSIDFYINFVSHGCFHTHGNLKIKFKKEFSNHVFIYINYLRGQARPWGDIFQCHGWSGPQIC